MSGTINCPKCGHALEPTTLEDIPIDQCSSCDGIWFDEQELQAVLTRSHNLGRGLRAGHSKPALNQKSGNCPRDKSALLRAFSTVDGRIVLDMCPSCNGLWLDGGELRRLVIAMNR